MRSGPFKLNLDSCLPSNLWQLEHWFSIISLALSAWAAHAPIHDQRKNIVKKRTVLSMGFGLKDGVLGDAWLPEQASTAEL